jgi:isoleucyl-tRNA synthetase
LQKEQFGRLGLFTNLDKFYVTYDNDFENRQLLVFANMIQQGLVYQDLKPVF